jgi:hypothetical protein
MAIRVGQPFPTASLDRHPISPCWRLRAIRFKATPNHEVHGSADPLNPDHGVAPPKLLSRPPGAASLAGGSTPDAGTDTSLIADEAAASEQRGHRARSLLGRCLHLPDEFG